MKYVKLSWREKADSEFAADACFVCDKALVTAHVLREMMSGMLCTNSQRLGTAHVRGIPYSAYPTFRKLDVSLSSNDDCHYSNISYDFLNVTA
jgi:hypothetical protein